VKLPSIQCLQIIDEEKKQKRVVFHL